ncbi:MAG: hypothetical protein PUE76_04380 [Bacteroides sp.]|nr:hypothetical protein [Bacteroides sp.]
MEGQDLVEEVTCHGKNTGKDHVEEEAPAEVEPLEARSPLTVGKGVRRQPEGKSEANLQRLHLRRGV